MNQLPSSIYHIQFSEDFKLRHAIEILPSLFELGLEGLYLSPIFEAASPHGYDIINPNRLNPFIGTRADFDELSNKLKEAGGKLILDVVPNHMGIKGKNLWWLDVLERGPSSLYADFFDIDWNPEKIELKNKVLLPILKNSYGESLVCQEIKLMWDEEGFWIGYADQKLPLKFQSYALIFPSHIESLPDYKSEHAPTWQALLAILEHGKKEELKALYDSSKWLQNLFEERIKLLNGIQGEAKSFDLLHELLEKQFYRLAHWITAGSEINYRRFFNINELAAIHIENPKVLHAHHQMVFEMLQEGRIQGLRIDHIDGLYDPTEYFERLQEEKPSLVIVEKILDIDEHLQSNWKVEGTVGYEFLNVLNGLFIDKRNEKKLTEIYERFIERSDFDFEELLYARKKWYIKMHMESEVNALGWRLDRLSEANRYYRDFTRDDLTQALVEVMANFAVYRTYVRSEEAVSASDRTLIFQVIEKAKLKTPEIDATLYDYLRDLLLKELKNLADENTQALCRDFAMRFQQQTAPIMAKALEDSCFYIYNRLLSLNEVGGDPLHFGVSQQEFHRFNIEKLKNHPLGFLPTSTHDTKRSFDVRMRLNVLSEIPQKWEEHLLMWSKMNEKYKKRIKGTLFPEPNTEYYLYQTLLGVWPLTKEEAQTEKFRERVVGSTLKAIREAGLHTSWRLPHAEYEEVTKQFLLSVITGEFYPSFIAFQKEISEYGFLNSLGALILQIASPGIFDLYQGDQGWNYSLMDPDNRRNVDYEALAKGSLKTSVIAKCLNFRRKYKELFLKGEYAALSSQNECKENIVAFERKLGEHSVVAISARFFTEIEGKSWGQTHILLPNHFKMRELKCVITGKSVKVQKKEKGLVLYASEVFQEHPFTILTSVNT